MTHIAGEDYDDDQDEEMYEESFDSDHHNSIKRSTSFQSRNSKCTQEDAESGENISEKSRENEVLQKYVLLAQNKELSLVLNCKTRWSFMYEMVERFICLKKCISKALLDLSIEHGICTTEFSLLNELKCALEPIKLAVEASCRKDATLLTAEGVFNFYLWSWRRGSRALRKIYFVP